MTNTHYCGLEELPKIVVQDILLGTASGVIATGILQIATREYSVLQLTQGALAATAFSCFSLVSYIYLDEKIRNLIGSVFANELPKKTFYAFHFLFASVSILTFLHGTFYLLFKANYLQLINPIVPISLPFFVLCNVTHLLFFAKLGRL